LDYKSIILEELSDIFHSKRWDDQENPIRNHIPELWERINHSNRYKELGENKNFKLLLELTEMLEESFNDDWLPFELFDLKLDDVKLFLEDLLDKLPNADEGSMPEIIKQSHKNIRKKL